MPYRFRLQHRQNTKTTIIRKNHTPQVVNEKSSGTFSSTPIPVNQRVLSLTLSNPQSFGPKFIKNCGLLTNH